MVDQDGRGDQSGRAEHEMPLDTSETRTVSRYERRAKWGHINDGAHTTDSVMPQPKRV
jgi:hypothetical protein